MSGDSEWIDVMSRAMVTVNTKKFLIKPLAEPFELMLSPIWEADAAGTHAVRRAFFAPQSMRAHYYEGPALALLQHPDLPRVVEAISSRPDDDRLPLTELLALYTSSEAPVFPLQLPWNENVAGLSLFVAHAARCARVGMTAEELLAGPIDDSRAAQLVEIEEEIRNAIASAPVDQLLAAMGGEAPASPKKPWWKVW